MNPQKYDEVNKIMKTLVYNVTTSPKIFKPSVAYTYARTNELYGDIFKIFVNNSDKELEKFLFLHECGHIIFSHCKNMDMRMDKFLEAKITSAYKKVAKLFPDEKSYLEMFKSTIFNIVMDFEVNSRLFNLEEWNFMQTRLQKLLENPTVQGFWPEDYGFKKGLTWNEYLNLILLNPEEFLSRFRFVKIFQKSNSQSGRPDFNGHLSQEEYENFKKEYEEKKLGDEELEELSKTAEDHTDSTFSIPTGQKGRSTEKAKSVTIHFNQSNDRKDLVSQIERTLHIKLIRPVKRDIMYNENRKKLNTGVIVPKTITEQKHTIAKLYLLIDASGSVDSKMIYDFVATFKQFSTHFKKTRIITWSTNLIDDWDIKEPIPNHYGGGTIISAGIDYIENKYSPKTKDVLFVISDFEDNLASWQNSLNKMKCKKYAINWSPELDAEIFNPGFQAILNGKFVE